MFLEEDENDREFGNYKIDCIIVRAVIGRVNF